MNKQLYYSSIVIGILIICSSIYFYSPSLLPLYIITYIGIVTSIINHGITNKSAKNLDRCIMVISAIIYIYYGLKIENKNIQIIILSTIGLMMFLYIISKFVKNFLENRNLSTNIHTIVHFISLILFIIIVMNEYFKYK